MLNTAPAPNSRRAAAWTPARRAKQSAMMHARKIWLKSTGPKTAAGKARAAQNGAKPWLKHHPDAVFKNVLRAHGRYLTDINRFIALKKIPYKNELLKRHLRGEHRRLLRLGQRITAELLGALAYAQRCKNLDFCGRFPVKVNTNDNTSRQ